MHHLQHIPGDEDLHTSRPSVRVTLAQICLTKEARITLGMAVQEVAAEFGMDGRTLAQSMSGEIYWRMDEDSLIFVLRQEELGADMFVQIPEEHWSFRNESHRMH